MHTALTDIPMTDNAEGDSAPLAAILDAMSETALLPKLTELVLDNVFVNQPANMDALSQLTAVGGACGLFVIK